MVLPPRTTDPGLSFANHLHVICSLNPETGGTVEGVRQLCQTAQRLGQKVEIATLDPPEALWAEGFGCPVHQLGPGRLGKYSYAPRFRRWLTVNAPRFDAVIVNGIWQYHSFATWQALHDSPTPYFVFTHGMLDPWFKRTYPLKHLKKWLYWPWADYRLLRDARAVLFTCEEEKLLARQSFGLYRAKETVVTYGTPGPEGDPEKQKESFLRAFPQLRARRLLLFLGRLHPKKGCDLLIKAFPQLAAEDQDLYLVMAGPDQTGWRHELETLAGSLGVAERIVWTGMLTGDLKWGAYRAAEAFVLPSHSENFGIVVAEALACGTPVLISNKVNIWREIQDADAGLVADDSLDGTTSMLKAWCGMSTFRKSEIGVNARQAFFRNFEIGIATRSLLEAINAGLTQPAPLAARI